MAFHGIAYGPDEHVLVTLDGPEVLAHDAQTEAPKWRLSFDHSLFAVLFADSGALTGGDGASPWRTPASRSCLVALDSAGNLHVMESMLGEKVGTVPSSGRPAAVASGANGTFALAVEDKVILWRNRERVEIPGRASALAFSLDGATLAIGGIDGGLRFMSIGGGSKPIESFCAVVHGGISDIAQHPGGTWIVCGKSGVSTVSGEGPKRLDRLPADVQRLRVDANGKRLAAQLSDRSVAVYSWPSLEVELRIEYPERHVGGLAFGPQNWLGVAIDHGDGNKIDITTSACHRTDTHPGRTHRSWLLSVRGKEAVFSAKEAEDIRRMKDPFHQPAPGGTGFGRGPSNNGGRIGIGVAISVALLCLRLCAAGSRSSSYSSSYPQYIPPSIPTIPTTSTPARSVKHVALVRLEGPELEPTTEDIPQTNTGEAEYPGHIWTAPDGSIFVSTMNGAHERSFVHRRDKNGAWSTVATRRTGRVVQLWGRSATDVVLMDWDSLAHWDGTSKTEIEPPVSRLFALGGIGQDVFVAGQAPNKNTGELTMQLYRRHGEGEWAVEPTTGDLAIKELWSGGNTLWGRALGKDGEDAVDDRLVQRANGKWTERKPFGATRPTSVAIRSVWVTPTGDAFVASDAGVFRSTGGGASWTKVSAATDYDGLWGRSPNDVYAATGDGVQHFDGKTWSKTSYTAEATAIGGTASELLVLVPAN
jgi:hypothetical protein